MNHRNEPTPVEATAYDVYSYALVLRRLANDGNVLATDVFRCNWGERQREEVAIRIAAIHCEANPEHKPLYKKVKEHYAVAYVFKRVTA